MARIEVQILHQELAGNRVPEDIPGKLRANFAFYRHQQVRDPQRRTRP